MSTFLSRSCLLCCVYLVAVCWSAALWSQQAPLKVTFVSPDPEVEGFWMLYKDIMLAAADDLNIELEVLHARGNRFDHYDRIQQVLSREQKPDYLVSLLLRNTTEKMLQAIELSGVKFFATNSDIPDEIRQYTGYPREKFNMWIGHARPDDYKAGKVLAETLIQQASRLEFAATSKINFLAITGARDSDAAFLRNAGLKKAIKATPGVVLQQLLFTDWQYQTAYDYFERLMLRYPQTQVFWCANDEIATAVIDARKAMGGDMPLFIGGIDWSHRGIGRYRAGEMDTSVGGHFIEGGLILALIRDHFDGHDFADELGVLLSFEMGVLNETNIELIESIVIQNDWHKLDFGLLSKSMQGHRNHWHSSYLQLINNIYRP